MAPSGSSRAASAVGSKLARARADGSATGAITFGIPVEITGGIPTKYLQNRGLRVGARQDARQPGERAREDQLKVRARP